MNEDKIIWCLKQNKGITLIEPNLKLSKSYIQDANKTLLNIFSVKDKWQVIIAYFACYEALYSLLMKAGIKSEIHDCSLGLMYIFDFEKEEIRFMKKLKQKRIKTQYYLKEEKLESELQVKKFVHKCEILLKKLNENKINLIRDLLKQCIK